MAVPVSSDLTCVKISKRRGTPCSLHITRRDLVPERKFDVAFWALDNQILSLYAAQ